MQEEHFLTEIEAHPENRQARLVYADWLEERGDERNKLIRVEEEMRSLPAYSDRYWELKPRREPLRAKWKSKKSGRAWLERMQYGTGPLAPLFGPVPDGWKERWRLIREFFERWQNVPMPDAGGPIPEIPGMKPRIFKGRNPLTGEAQELKSWEFPPIETHLSDSWPPAVREWFAFVRYLRTLPRDARPELVASAEYSYDDIGHATEVVLTSNDGHRSHYMVPQDDSRHADPGVHFFDNTSNNDAGVVFPHVTSFAFWFILRTCFPGETGLRDEVEPARMKPLLKLLKSCDSVASFDMIKIFESQNFIVLVGPNTTYASPNNWIYVDSRGDASAEMVEAIRELCVGLSFP